MQYRPDEPRLGIAMFMPSNERLDWAVQKISETGADDIFLITDTNDRRGGRTISQARIDRLRRVIREACAQAGRVFLPILHEPMRLADFLEKFQNEVALCAPGGAGPTLDRVIWLIGPESGLVSVQAGIPEVSLSPNVLRIETAAVVASAIQVALRARLLAHPNI
jgi:16S rRNA (uracil1498-N3)-methyltransferase